LPSFIYAGPVPRFYPQELDADGKSLTAVPGTVHVWAEAPADGQWLPYGDEPAEPAEQPAEAVVPVPEPVPAPEPEPVPVAVPEPVPAQPEPVQPVPAQPEPAALQAPPAPFPFPGFAPPAQPYTR
jgi:hypothetical protein